MGIVLDLARGFCMALADSVPGVSGGTIAFILGFYDKFITSLAHLVRGTKKERALAVKFLLKILCGWVIGFGLSVLFLGSIFDRHIYQLSSLFIGLSLSAIPIVIWQERKVLKDRKRNIVWLFVGLAIVVAVTALFPAGVFSGTSDLAGANAGSYVYLFFVSMLAISAMVLPGVSGSTILLIFGLYVPVVNAVRNLLHFDFSYLLPVVICGLGLIAGVVLVIRLVRAGLERHRSAMIYLILGLMAGSVYAIVMGPTTMDEPLARLNFATFSIPFFLIGVGILVVLQLLRAAMDRRKKASENS